MALVKIASLGCGKISQVKIVFLPNRGILIYCTDLVEWKSNVSWEGHQQEGMSNGNEPKCVLEQRCTVEKWSGNAIYLMTYFYSIFSIMF